MMAKQRLYAPLVVLGMGSPAVPLWALPPCGSPGTITMVTAPDGEHLAAFGDYKSYLPVGLALDPAGQVYVADASLIYRLEADGTATRIVGVPQTRKERRDNVLQDSVAALEVHIAPGAMAFDRQGRLYFVDHVNWAWVDGGGRRLSRIARLEADGQVVTFAGTGEYGSDGDGGPAKEARFGYIGSLVFDREGNLLVSGTGGIRRIDGQGMVSTLVEAASIGSLTMDEQGVLYFFTLGDQVFRRSVNGEIEHVAGSGVELNRIPVKGGRYVAEGRPATEAPLDVPSGLVIDEQGALYIANFNHNLIHRVRPDGILETIAGNGRGNASAQGCGGYGKRVVGAGKRVSDHRCQDHIGDGGPALEAIIWWPFRLLLTPEGDLLVSMLQNFQNDMDWSGGAFSQLRRICGVSEGRVPTAVAAVEEEPKTSGSEEALPALRLYPNPFNAAVTLTFHLAHSASVSVHIYNELGQQVRVLAAEELRSAGSYQFVWDGRDQAGQSQASGTYFLMLSVDGATETHKLTLLH